MPALSFLNGRFVSIQEARIPALDAGFLYGFGIFESMRSYKNKIVYLDRHLERLQDSARLVGIRPGYTAKKLKAIIKETVRRNGFKDAYVRLTLWRAQDGTGTFVLAKSYKPHSARRYKNGFKACISNYRQNENSPLSRIKTTSRLLYELSFQQAKGRGFDEGLLLNSRGYIAEATRSNVFFVKDKEIFTPSLECGCLDGITRKAVFDLAERFRISEGKFRVEDLQQADEAFLTNSLMGIMPIASIEKKKIGKNKCAKVTEFLIKRYNCLLK